jgi:hypothetical protein
MPNVEISCIAVALLLILPVIVLSDEAARQATGASAGTPDRLCGSVVGAAGHPGESAGLKVNGTLGQPTAIGIGSAAGRTAYMGFWGRRWIPTPVDDIPSAFRDELYQNHPNPFNPSTTIEFSVARDGIVEIAIFNVKGQRIKTLVEEHKSPGRYRAIWDGRNERGSPVSSGIYFYRLRTATFGSVKKMLLLR